MNRTVVLLLLFLLGTTVVVPSPLSFTLHPACDIPLGSDQFTVGGSVTLGGEYRLPFLPAMAARVEVGYGYLPVITEGGVNLFQAGTGLSVGLGIGDLLSATGGSTIGYYYGSVGGSGGGNIYARGTGSLEITVAGAISLGIQARYQWMSDGAGGSVFSGIGVAAGLRYTVLSGGLLEVGTWDEE